MGVNFKDIILKKEVSIADLKGKKLVVDAFNVIYQFLATIRQMDGTPLKDSKGNVTSHLSGLFHRTTKLMRAGLKLAFVFDGIPPELKQKERLRRAQLKHDATLKFKEAEQKEDIAEMKKYAMRTSRLTPDMVEESKILLSALGLPIIQAPSEGEAQAAQMVSKGDVYAEISQDYDCLLFGVPRMIQNLTISERKKRRDKLSYEIITPKLLTLTDNLNNLGIDQDQLIVIGMLVGTDFNVGGIKGIGPKKAIETVKKYKNNFDQLFIDLKWDDYFDCSWSEVFYLIKKMPTTDEYELEWKPIDYDKVIEILVVKHSFNETRVRAVLDKLKKDQSQLSQKGIGDFF